MSDTGRLLGYLRPYSGRLVFALFCSAVVGGSMAALTSLLIPIVDGVLLSGVRPAPAGPVPGAGSAKAHALSLVREHLDPAGWLAAAEGSRSMLVALTAFLVVVFLVRGIALYFSSYYIIFIGQMTVRDLRQDLYECIQRQSLRFFSGHPTGLLISRVTNDVDRIKLTLSRQLEDTFRLLFTFVAVTAYVFYLHWGLATICLIVAPVVITPVVKFGRRLKTTSRKSQERMADLSNLLHETITGSHIVRGYGREAFEIGRFRQALERLLHMDLKAARILSLAPPFMELVGALIGALLLAYAGRAIAAGTLDPGVFLAFLTGIGIIYATTKKLSKIYNDVAQAMAATRRVFDVLDAEIDVVEAPGARALAPFRNEIRFKGVDFSYDREPVLRGIDLTVRAGEVVALVGRSGGGKTTLINLIPRFYDVTGGQVTIDGLDVRGATFASLRGQIGIVTQDVILFNDTVKNNIAYGLPDADPQAIRAAAGAAFADGFIEQMPEGYDTILGERGHRLSQGQRQRISIARALLKDAPILVLDEATSSLDSESEALVQRAIQNLMRGRTTLVIAHRLSTFRLSDRIYVLEGGAISEVGTHRELLARGGLYSQLHRSEFLEAEPARSAAGT